MYKFQRLRDAGDRPLPEADRQLHDEDQFDLDPNPDNGFCRNPVNSLPYE